MINVINSVDNIVEVLERDFFMSATGDIVWIRLFLLVIIMIYIFITEAVEFGLVDSVIESRKVTTESD